MSELASRLQEARAQLGQNRLDAAQGVLDEVLREQPGTPAALLLRGGIHERRGAWETAENDYRQALAAERSTAALLALGQLVQRRGELEPARALYREAADRKDQGVRPGYLLCAVLARLGRTAEAEQFAEDLSRDFPDQDLAWQRLGEARQARGDLHGAAAAFERAHALLRRPGPPPAFVERGTFHRTNRAKFRHDLEQLAYLAERGIGGLEPVIRAYQEVEARLPGELQPGEIVQMPARVVERFSPWYNRCHHREPAPAIAGGALNPELDWPALEQAYFRSGPGMLHVDGWLRPEALTALRRYCLESTIWYDADHARGYVGSYFHDGFACPLVVQIAEELPRRLPRVFGPHGLTTAWAYKYDSELSGIDMHADAAAVNVNFWLTPDEANLDPQSGGLVLWDREAPADWDPDRYNRADPEEKRRILAWLEEEGAERRTVPHRQNRAVIFNSDLFHRTDDIRFRPGYENRRINVTMLFGQRTGR
ncbi:MAG: tetratricopeptide repeat protein [Gammaproteobacteria bacterium]|nr:tetratricopeptide repeat protein [Gammaproteobacteria bacterium]